jgi:ATP-dependent Clp protease adapter protein ClpS
MSETKPIIDTREKISPNLALKQPPDYNVIYINDEITTQTFVMETLTLIFNYAEESAAVLTQKVHEEGSAVVATLPYEMAEQKGIEVTLLARNNGFPLAVKIEADT